MDIESIINSCEGFQWDQGNSLKSWLKHRVNEGEAEQIFFNEPLLLLEDETHSIQEKRFWAIGCTDRARLLLVVFTIRKGLIRVISARDASKKERQVYEKSKTRS